MYKITIKTNFKSDWDKDGEVKYTIQSTVKNVRAECIEWGADTYRRAVTHLYARIGGR